MGVNMTQYVAYPDEHTRHWVLTDSIIACGWFCRACGGKVSCKLTADGSYKVRCNCGRKEAAGGYLN